MGNEEKKIRCTINGDDHSLAEGISLMDFLGGMKVPYAGVVVELNREVLPKGSYDGIILKDGDTLEIVQLIGGG